MHARLLDSAAEEAALQKEKNRELLAFMKVHALADDRERCFAEGALKNAELWREMEELQSACAEDAAQGTRPAQLVQSARGAYEEYLASTARVGQQWQADAALIDAECESELGRLRSFDDDLVDQSARSVEAGLAYSAADREELVQPESEPGEASGAPAAASPAPQARPLASPVSRGWDERAPADPMQAKMGR
eukprot:scaffold5896_cov116-Isochrysis_galbana.AAC.2